MIYILKFQNEKVEKIDSISTLIMGDLHFRFLMMKMFVNKTFDVLCKN